jgi:hypothetical protein
LGAFEGVLPSSSCHLTAYPLEKQEETQATPVILSEDLGSAVAGRRLTDSLGLKSIAKKSYQIGADHEHCCTCSGHTK